MLLERPEPVPVSNVEWSKVPEQTSNKDEEADQPSSSKRSVHPTSDSELDFSQMSIYSERELLSEWGGCWLHFDERRSSQIGWRCCKSTLIIARPLLQPYYWNLPRVKQTLFWFSSHGLMETESVVSERPHIPFSMRKVGENPELAFLLRNNCILSSPIYRSENSGFAIWEIFYVFGFFVLLFSMKLYFLFYLYILYNHTHFHRKKGILTLVRMGVKFEK